MAELPDIIRISGTDDISKNYLLFVDYRQQGKSAITKLTLRRIICNNTLAAALESAGDMNRIRHTGNYRYKMEAAKDVMSGVDNDVKLLNTKLNFLAGRKMTKDSITEVIKQVLPNVEDSKIQQNRAEDILEIYESNDNDTFKKTRGSAYNMLNAITNYVDHHSPVTLRNQDDKGTLVKARDQKRAENVLFGSGDKLKSESLNFILQTVENNPPMPQGVGLNQKITLDNIMNNMAVN